MESTDEQDEFLTTTERKLREIWASALDQRISEVSVDRDMLDFADSLTVLRVSACVTKEMEVDFTSQDIYLRRTIKAQASALESSRLTRTPPGALSPPTKHSNSPRSERPRTCPPHVYFGLAHLCYEMERLPLAQRRSKVNEGFKKTKDAINKSLEPFSLSWANVEDVLPMTSISSYMFERETHPQSRFFRTALTTTKTCEQVREAIKAVLANHPILRTIAIRYEGKPLHVVIRSSPQWLKHLVVTEEDVDDPDGLKKLDLKMAVEGERPLFRAIISNVRSTKTAGLIIVVSHACLDAISISLFIEDIATCLAVGFHALKPHASYKIYACNYILYEDESIAEKNCRFFARLLRDISSYKNAAWPPQRHPKNVVFGDSSYLQWTYKKEKTEHPPERLVLEGKDNEHGIEGLSHTIKLPYLTWLRNSYGISASVLLKAAVVLFNIKETDAKEAHFALPHAGRSWPFSQGYSESELKETSNPPIDINGPTWELLFDRVRVKKHEKVGHFLKRLQSAQSDLSLHAHAPLDGVLSLMSDNDAWAVQKVMTQQMLNWYPDLLKENFGSPTQPPVLNRIQLRVNMPCDYVWSGAMYGAETMMLNASYDDAQYSAEEVRGWVAMTLSAVEWLCDPEHWELEVGKCQFESDNVVSWG